MQSPRERPLDLAGARLRLWLLCLLRVLRLRRGQQAPHTNRQTDTYTQQNAVPSAFGKATQTPGADGVGLSKALNGYAKWTIDVMIPYACENMGYWTGKHNLACYDTYNASSPVFTDTSVDNAIDRQWNWLLCNEP